MTPEQMTFVAVILFVIIIAAILIKQNQLASDTLRELKEEARARGEDINSEVFADVEDKDER